MFITRFLTLIAVMVLASCSTDQPPWNDQELAIIQSFQLNRLPPKDSPSNQYANNPQAASLGKAIFFDPQFSLGATLSCAGCHKPELAFTDGLPKAQGIMKTGRNTQSILGAAYHNWFYWDGRKDSLWAQALVPFEAADEMASNRVRVLRIIGADERYRREYEALFGTFPTMVFQPSIPDEAGPWGNEKSRKQWFGIPQHARHTINKAYANIGKAVAAYMRTLDIPKTRFDHYVETLENKGETAARAFLSEQETLGLKLFINEERTHCLRCHNGPLFTNGDFHNIGSGRFKGEQLDFGRYLGVMALQQDAFNCLGRYSDAEPEQCQSLRFLQREVHEELKGAFKTPSLRNLDKTAPYFHDGRFGSLEAVLQHYLAPQTPDSELPDIQLDDTEQQAILAFLKTLTHDR